LLGPGVMGTDVADLYFGDIQMQIVLGQVFGFRVGSQDNLFLPGILTLSDLSFTPNASITELTAPTPEPGTLSLLVVAVGAAFVVRRRMVVNSDKNEVSE